MLSPIAILWVIGINIIVIKAGIDSFIVERSSWATFLNINIPTITRAGATANTGIASTIGAMKRASRKNNPVNIEASPVLAPTFIPAIDSP